MKTRQIYLLPISREDFTFGCSDSRAHKPGQLLEHAIDFPLPEGTPVLAAQEGIVINVYTESNEGGSDQKFRDNINKYLNRIRIQHTETEFTDYAHLMHKSEKVSVGENVKKGQAIALSGNTGLSSEPHLHFHVMYISGDDRKTMEIQWEKPFDIARK